MKKVIYILLAIVAIAVYSCQKDNTAPTKKITPSLKSVSTTLKIRKDTTPPDPMFIKKAVRDTTPPDPLLK
ncbi:MAG: hypothetical protein WC615_10615 [Mucilaginibacter sp.]|jgi:hypothetical protein|uniref:hypothetical protein n=1 Tax=Mucilaginibacter sp. TaxID=1882438 RepID=UPI0035680D15